METNLKGSRYTHEEELLLISHLSGRSGDAFDAMVERAARKLGRTEKSIREKWRTQLRDNARVLSRKEPQPAKRRRGRPSSIETANRTPSVEAYSGELDIMLRRMESMPAVCIAIAISRLRAALTTARAPKMIG